MEGKHIRTAAYFVPAAVNAASARQVTSVSLQLGRIIQEKAGASALHLRLVPLDQAAGTIVPNNIALFASYVQKEASGAKSGRFSPARQDDWACGREVGGINGRGVRCPKDAHACGHGLKRARNCSDGRSKWSDSRWRSGPEIPNRAKW